MPEEKKGYLKVVNMSTKQQESLNFFKKKKKRKCNQGIENINF